jgi:hypothetical protein
MEADISILRKTGHFYFALTPLLKSNRHREAMTTWLGPKNLLCAGAARFAVRRRDAALPSLRFYRSKEFSPGATKQQARISS